MTVCWVWACVCSFVCGAVLICRDCKLASILPFSPSPSQVERFINSPDAHRNPPDFQDIHHVVVRAKERYNLCLSRKQLNQIAKEAFRDVATSMQNRRKQDLLYDFGSTLTDRDTPGEPDSSACCVSVLD